MLLREREIFESPHSHVPSTTAKTFITTYFLFLPSAIPLPNSVSHHFPKPAYKNMCNPALMLCSFRLPCGKASASVQWRWWELLLASAWLSAWQKCRAPFGPQIFYRNVQKGAFWVTVVRLGHNLSVELKTMNTLLLDFFNANLN